MKQLHSELRRNLQEIKFNTDFYEVASKQNTNSNSSETSPNMSMNSSLNWRRKCQVKSQENSDISSNVQRHPGRDALGMHCKQMDYWIYQPQLRWQLSLQSFSSTTQPKRCRQFCHYKQAQEMETFTNYLKVLLLKQIHTSYKLYFIIANEAPVRTGRKNGCMLQNGSRLSFRIIHP